MKELKIIQQLESFNVLLIGDNCSDVYNMGVVERLSPEAPVPVLKITDTYTVDGMASNVRNNFVKLGVKTNFITSSETIIKSRYIDKRSGQHMLRVDNDVELTPWDGILPDNLDTYNAIVISDYDKGFLTYEHIEAIIKKTKVPVFIDTKKKDLKRFDSDRVYVKINETEFKNKTSSPKNLIVTLGSEGAVIYRNDIPLTFPTDAVEVVDVCGCGDTFLATLTTQYLLSNDIEVAVIYANIGAGMTVQHQGNFSPRYKDIYYARY